MHMKKQMAMEDFDELVRQPDLLHGLEWILKPLTNKNYLFIF